MIIVSYGPHAMYYRVGNMVECRFCRYSSDPGNLPLGYVYCRGHLEVKMRGERCVRFRRAPGSDDDAPPFFPFGDGES
jgi:hypothetical protein